MAINKNAISWDDKKIEVAILELMKNLNIERFPTTTEMVENKNSGLSRAISLSGGVYVWSERLNIKRKTRFKKWNQKTIIIETKKSMETLQTRRLPTRSELESIGRGDLHNAISKNMKYRGLSELMKVELKESETTKGYDNEMIVKEILESKGFEVKEMTTKHPFDLLVDNSVKVEVKSGMKHDHFGSPTTTFGLGNKYSACDLYVCVGYKERNIIENIFIIPSNKAQVVTLNVGKESKYNKYINDWDLVNTFSNFYDTFC